MDKRTLGRDVNIDPELVNLLKLLKAVRELPPMSPEQMREQTISFAYGSLSLHNPAITREMVERAYDEIHPK